MISPNQILMIGHQDRDKFMNPNTILDENIKPIIREIALSFERKFKNSGIKDVFFFFDLDCNGTINESEWLLGLASLGLDNITKD